MELAFSVPGTPAPQGSFRPVVSKSTGKPMLKSNEAGGYLRYRADLRAVATERMREHVIRSDGIAVTVVFAFPRPEGHWLPANSRRDEPVLRPGAPQDHTQQPDVDKLVRAVLDALTGIVYLDDAQVVGLGAVKRWIDTHGAGGHTAVTIATDPKKSDEQQQEMIQ